MVPALALMLLSTSSLAAQPFSEGAMGPRLADAYGVDAADSTATVEPVGGRQFDLEVNFRGRRVSVPNVILDSFYYRHDAPGSNPDDHPSSPLDGVLPRPSVQGYAAGIELVVKGDNANGIFYVEYIKSQMEAGYWDDIEDPALFIDGEYLAPTDNLGFFTVGANYAYEAHLIPSAKTNRRFAWSVLVGGGLGIGIRTGRIDRWVADNTLDDSESIKDPAYRLYEDGEPPFTEKRGVPPRFIPMVDINAGTRFTFGDRFVIRIEGGLHTLLYYGASAGLMF